ncbi:hypothetical protein PFISCL1PPCAC_19191, partial [Pristionchus fissidentatus]
NRRMNEIASTFKYSIDELSFTDVGSRSDQIRIARNNALVSIDGSPLIYLSTKDMKLHYFFSTMRRLAHNTTVRMLRIEASPEYFSPEIRNFLVEIAADELVMEDPGIYANLNATAFSPLVRFLHRKRRGVISGAYMTCKRILKLYTDMLSRKFDISSLDFIGCDSNMNSVLFALHEVKFVWRKRMDGRFSQIHFTADEDGKTVLYRECPNNGSFSILHFTGLLMTEFYRNADNQSGIRLNWFEKEEEMKERKENYKIATAIKI